MRQGALHADGTGKVRRNNKVVQEPLRRPACGNRVEGAREQNVGKPQGTPAGNFTLFSAMVAFEPSEFLAVSAVGLDGQRSAPSGWGAMPPTRPGQPQLQD